MPQFYLTWNTQGFYTVSIPNFDGGECVTIDMLESAEARAAALEAERDVWIAKLQAYDEIEKANKALAAELKRIESERDRYKQHIEAYVEKFDDQSLSNDEVKRWLDRVWIPESRDISSES